MAGLIGLLIGTVVVGLVGGVLIWIVSNLGWGLHVDGFGAAFISAIVIAIVSNVVIWLLGSLGLLVANAGLFGAIISLIISAVILLLAVGRREALSPTASSRGCRSTASAARSSPRSASGCSSGSRA